MTHTSSRNGSAKNGLAKLGLAKLGQIRMAKTILANQTGPPRPSPWWRDGSGQKTQQQFWPKSVKWESVSKMSKDDAEQTENIVRVFWEGVAGSKLATLSQENGLCPPFWGFQPPFRAANVQQKRLLKVQRWGVVSGVVSASKCFQKVPNSSKWFQLAPGKWWVVPGGSRSSALSF